MNGTEGGDVESEKKIGKSWKRNREERNQRKQDPNLESKEVKDKRHTLQFSPTACISDKRYSKSM